MNRWFFFLWLLQVVHNNAEEPSNFANNGLGNISEEIQESLLSSFEKIDSIEPEFEIMSEHNMKESLSSWAMNWNMTSKDIRLRFSFLVDKIDRNKDKEIDYDEFKKYLNFIYEMSCKKKIQSEFLQLDISGNGKIDIRELLQEDRAIDGLHAQRKESKSLFIDGNSKIYERQFEEVDYNKDKELDFQEFSDLLKPFHSSISIYYDTIKLYQQYDLDDDSKISVLEFVKVEKLNSDESNDIYEEFVRLDSNADGQLSQDELITAISKYNIELEIDAQIENIFRASYALQLRNLGISKFTLQNEDKLNSVSTQFLKSHFLDFAKSTITSNGELFKYPNAYIVGIENEDYGINMVEGTLIFGSDIPNQWVATGGMPFEEMEFSEFGEDEDHFETDEVDLDEYSDKYYEIADADETADILSNKEEKTEEIKEKTVENKEDLNSETIKNDFDRMSSDFITDDLDQKLKEMLKLLENSPKMFDLNESDFLRAFENGGMEDLKELFNKHDEL